MTMPLPDPATCFSLRQPYAGLVALGLKDETRLYPWPVKRRPYPSPLLICSTLTRDRGWAPEFAERLRREAPMSGLHWLTGVALALVDVVGCRVLTEADLPRSWYWDPAGDKGRARYLWAIANVRRVRPFKVAGRQGFARSVPLAIVHSALSGAGRSR